MPFKPAPNNQVPQDFAQIRDFAGKTISGELTEPEFR